MHAISIWYINTSHTGTRVLYSSSMLHVCTYTCTTGTRVACCMLLPTRVHVHAYTRVLEWVALLLLQCYVMMSFFGLVPRPRCYDLTLDADTKYLNQQGHDLCKKGRCGTYVRYTCTYASTPLSLSFSTFPMCHFCRAIGSMDARGLSTTRALCAGPIHTTLFSHGRGDLDFVSSVIR